MACDQTNLSYHEGELDREDVRALLAHHVAEMSGASPREACHVLEADSLRDPAIRFLSVRDGGQLVAVGALKQLDAAHGELKSMRVAPPAVGQGIGKALLQHLVDLARKEGLSRLSLETGNSTLFTPAINLYERNGFEPCGPFADHRETPFTLFYTRAI